MIMPKAALKKKEKQSAYKSVFRTAAILNCLNKGISTVSDIAENLKINKSTVYRLLQALVDAEITLRNPVNRHYYIGPLIAQIAANPGITHNTLVLCAANEMEHLSELTGESIAMNVLVGINTYILHEIPSIHDIQIVAKKSVGYNLHAGANSRILLSQLEGKELRKVINNISFVRLTERTITSKEELLEELKKIRKQEYAIGCGERAQGAMSISVPIKNYVLPASLGILGLEERMKPRTAEYIDALMKAGAHVEYNLSRIYKDNEMPQ
jgi:IclR family KDG regulon transcriptional repressor